MIKMYTPIFREEPDFLEEKLKAKSSAADGSRETTFEQRFITL